MAKGLRASTKKANKSKLRANVFNPVEEARKERLSTRLLELAAQPKPRTEEDLKMEEERSAGPPAVPPYTVVSKFANYWTLKTTRNRKMPLAMQFLLLRKKASVTCFHHDSCTRAVALTSQSMAADMDLDDAEGLGKASSRSGSSGRIQKKGRSKLRASTVFPVYKKGKRIGPRLSKRQKRQSLRP